MLRFTNDTHRHDAPSRLGGVALLQALVLAGTLGACSKDEPKPESGQTEPPATAAEDGAEEALEKEEEPAEDEAAEADGDESKGGAGAVASAAAKQGKAGASASEKGQKSEPREKAAEAPKEQPKQEEGYTGPNPCRTEKFKFSFVKKACNEGGVKKAKNVMKSVVKRAKDDGKKIDGKKIKCSSCHDDTKTYTSKPNAGSELKKIL